MKNDMEYTDERFADIQMLRYRLDGFDKLTQKQKTLIYYLSEATLWGRDITFDQFGKYNLKVRKTLEAVYVGYKGDRGCEAFRNLEVYLKRVWFSSGIYHHYGCDKFVPGFSAEYLLECVNSVDQSLLPLNEGQTPQELVEELESVMFDPTFKPKRVCLDSGVDVVEASACNFYDGVSQHDVEEYYSVRKREEGELLSHGLNTTLRKENGAVVEEVWRVGGLYGKAIQKIVFWLEKAAGVAENERQRQYIRTLIDYYKTGDLAVFNRYCIEWVGESSAIVDFVNGFIEVYGDPLGLKGSWEGIVEYRDEDATRRMRLISENAQWFEDHSPVDARFRKKVVSGVKANVVRAAMLGGDEYPSTAIGINLPNADWIRAQHGSKSVTISNLIDAYNKAAHGNGFKEEFIEDGEIIRLIDEYGDLCDDIHTDLHECLGHGSGRLLDGVSPDALKSYGSTIEEARADLFGLYYIADEKMIELGLLPDADAYKASYYSYMLNGLMTQLVRIARGANLEESHMRNRALIARWCFEHGCSENVIEMYEADGKTYVRINDFRKLRSLIAELLTEVQRIKSEGDFDAAKSLVENYGVRVDDKLHEEVLGRYERLGLAPYKGFINPVLVPVYGDDGGVVDVEVDYSESYENQMLRYSKDYASLV